MDISDLVLLYLKYYFAIWIVILVIFSLIIYTIIYNLAKKQIIFTFCDEGEIIVVTAGGNYHKLIYSIDKWVYNKIEKIFEPGKKDIGLFEKHLGIYFIGLPFFTKIHEWDFSWNKWSKPEGQTEYKIIPRSGKVKAFKFQFPYAIKVSGVEIQGQIEINFELQVTLRAVNVYNALFKGGKWLDQVTGAIESTTKEILGQLDIDQIRTMKTGEPTMTEFIDKIKLLTPQLIELAGQEIVDVKLLSFKQVGGEDIKQATQAKEKARLEGDAKIETASKSAKAAKEKAEEIKTLADAERYRLEKTMPFDPNTVKWNSIRRSGLNTYVEGGSDSGTGVNVNTPPPEKKK